MLNDILYCVLGLNNQQRVAMEIIDDITQNILRRTKKLERI